MKKYSIFFMAAAGIAGLNSMHAEERVTPLLTALSSTTISGYVDASAHWNPGTGNANAAPVYFNGPGKRDGFNLNAVLVSIQKPLDEAEFSAGYRADLMFGPDAGELNLESNIRQAFVALRAPLGNGLDFKLGVWDSILGFESIDGYKNPNYTRSYGFTIQPKTHTGLLVSYVVSDLLAFNIGVANNLESDSINAKPWSGSSGLISGPLASSFPVIGIPGFQGANAKAESFKSYMGSVTLTAPDATGFLAGSSLVLGAATGYSDSILGTGIGNSQQNYYAAATIATPIEALRLGASFDYLRSDDVLIEGIDIDIWTAALYASFAATDKLSLHLRGEIVDAELDTPFGDVATELYAVTATLQYDLWDNVLSRLEVRWDHADDAKAFGGRGAFANPSKKNDLLIAANLIYRF